jgi:hypothetical protein
VIHLQTLYPPAWVIPLRLRVSVCAQDQRLTLTHETSQACVDKPALGLCGALLAGSLDRLIDQGMNRVRRIGIGPTQSQGTAEQGIDSGGRCFSGQKLS